MWTLHGQKYVVTLLFFYDCSHSKTMGVTLTASTLMISGFPPDFGTRLQEFAPIQTQSVRSNTDSGGNGLAHMCSSSSQRCWTGLGSGLCAGQSSSATLTGRAISLWTRLCAWRPCCVKTGKDLPQTVATKLEAYSSLEYHCMLQQ